MKKFFLYLWELPQNLLGMILSIGCTKHDWFGVKFYSKKKFFKSGISLGNYIIFDEVILNMDGKKAITFLLHERGHRKQSKYLGWFYFILVGIPSLLRKIYSKIFKKSNKWYYSGYPEKWADRLGGVSRY